MGRAVALATVVAPLLGLGTVPPTAIGVASFPSAIAVGGGSVWVVAGGRLTRIDPRTRRVVARIDVGVRVGSERPCDLAVAGGVVWTLGAVSATRSLVVRVDARTGHVLGATPTPPAACVAATADAAWVTLPRARRLVRLDDHGHVVRQVATRAYCDAIVAGHGAFWTACPAGAAGARVGSHTGTILRIGARGSLVVVAHDVLSGSLAAGPAGVFASGVGHDSGRTVRVDAPGARFPGSGRVSVGRSTLWLADWRGPGRPGFAREVDARSGRTLRTIAAGTSPVAVALGVGAVWLANYTAPGRVTRIVP
ncbi:MAG TPA: hypothetical protein VFL66_13070 [Gaiellaceae bacterium]|nr:hypothetical protein [Gaiellaceae bacterium]